MSRNLLLITGLIILTVGACKIKTEPISFPMKSQLATIDSKTREKCIDTLKAAYPAADTSAILTGVNQAAAFWTRSDGSKVAFIAFCKKYFLPDEASRERAMDKISRDLEILSGHFNEISVELKEPLDEDMGPITPIDEMFGGYNPEANLSEDLFKNKIAFYLLLNFKHYTLDQKTRLGLAWSRKQWAMARLGDFVTSRVPGTLQMKFNDVNTRTNSYISDYNIYMHCLVDSQGKSLFPEGMKLISHWGLRDELKADYNSEDALEKQRMIYSVMKRIIDQDIPACMIDSNRYRWNPEKNKVYSGNREITFVTEPDTRYEWLLRNFKALKAFDAYDPFYPTYISSQFDHSMEIPQPEIEKLFIHLLQSPEVNKVATLIRNRLGRNLEPFDIWYDGFKERSMLNIPELDRIVRKKYPTSQAFQNDIPNILVKLGFTASKAKYIASEIEVDASRGAGHAWGARMKGFKARLRTRVGPNGMDYKGYNIAMHELGHCVEQTLTLYDMDYYLLSGVPNTAFTEALAFVFQSRDLQVLGIKNNNPEKQDLATLDIFWTNYEIMGVSLVDMNVWKWMYQHPNATKAELKDAVIAISKNIWNQYYAPVFGIKDQPILAIYSHMIEDPLYLSAYPIGYLIDFQIEKTIRGKNFGDEIMQLFSKGSIVPQVWLKESLGMKLTDQPLLEAVDQSVNDIEK